MWYWQSSGFGFVWFLLPACHFRFPFHKSSLFVCPFFLIVIFSYRIAPHVCNASNSGIPESDSESGACSVSQHDYFWSCLLCRFGYCFSILTSLLKQHPVRPLIHSTVSSHLTRFHCFPIPGVRVQFGIWLRTWRWQDEEDHSKQARADWQAQAAGWRGFIVSCTNVSQSPLLWARVLHLVSEFKSKNYDFLYADMERE